jgi:tetratricopeptide (TPR) repeat protein
VALILVCILLTSNASAEKFGEKCYKSPNFSCIISLAITSALATNDDGYKSELLSKIAKLLVYNSQSSEAKDHIRSIPNAYRQRIIGAIVEAKFAIGKKEEGLTVLKEMGPPSTWTLANLSKTYQLGKFRDKLKPIIIKSESLIKELKETYYKIGALSELSTFCFNIGNSEKAEQLLQEAKRFAKTLRDTKEYTRAQAQIAKAYVSGGNIKEGLAFSRSLIKNYQIKRKSDPDNFLLPYDVLVGVAIEVLSDIAIYLHDNGNQRQR